MKCPKCNNEIKIINNTFMCEKCNTAYDYISFVCEWIYRAEKAEKEINVKRKENAEQACKIAELAHTLLNRHDELDAVKEELAETNLRLQKILKQKNEVKE